MYTIKDIDDEIQNKVEWLERNNGRALHKEWIINEVVSSHVDIQGDDADIALCCIRHTVDTRVRVYWNKHKANDNIDPQLVLPGFVHLQQRYLIKRDDERVIVRVQDMTQAELEAKAAEYTVMGEACIAHANEILRFSKSMAAG